MMDVMRAKVFRESFVDWLIVNGYADGLAAEDMADHLMDDFEMEWK